MKTAKEFETALYGGMFAQPTDRAIIEAFVAEANEEFDALKALWLNSLKRQTHKGSAELLSTLKMTRKYLLKIKADELHTQISIQKAIDRVNRTISSFEEDGFAAQKEK